MSIPYHMQEIGDDKVVLPEEVDNEGDTIRVSVDMESPGGTRELKVNHPLSQLTGRTCVFRIRGV